ncbi:MAG TPA: superoxide dismutase [Vicinamibacterales bacterium]|nr:superoxide dismutase [Vicinamibacterales bacterium]
MTRRQMIALTSASAVLAIDGVAPARALGQTPAAAPAGPFVLPPLPYPADALEPHLDAQTMTIHHDRHHAAYVTNLNAALANRAELKTRTVEDLVAHLNTLPEDVRTAVRNQGGGHLNHTWFWPSLKKGGSSPPAAEFGRAIDEAFASFAKLKDALTTASVGVFGSGWGWLSLDRTGKLVVETTPNQDNPLSSGNHPLLGIDVWEHAYYLKYQNRRRDYVDALFNVIDWDVVQSRWRGARG